MIDIILKNIPGIMAALPVLLIINAVLSGISVTLDKLVAMGKIPAANPVVATVGKIAGYLKMIIDILSANVKH